MLKRRVKKHLIKAILLFLTFFPAGSEGFSQPIKKENCYLLADGKRVPLFNAISSVKKLINVARDIEYLDTKVFLYGYDGKISKRDKYLITPQILFFVDTAKRMTIKEEIHYDIERRKSDGSVTKADLPKILYFIKSNTIPFLDIPKNPDFDNSYTANSGNYSYDIKITKVKKEDSSENSLEFTILIALINPLVK